MCKVLVTGDRGYIGSVLVKELITKGHDVTGIDAAYFEDCLLSESFDGYERITKDIRDVVAEDLKNIDAIIHLAGLSNDPLGELNEALTDEINHDACTKLARSAKNAGVKRFIYASSQSMYGIAKGDEEIDEYKSDKNPITVYAKTKWLAEQEINHLGDDEFCVVSFRPSTVFGVSPRLRSDIVFNNLVACAYTTGKIEIKSDGSPWRPVVHIKDVCRAFIAGLDAPTEKINKRAYNVGIKNGNYTVRDLAEAAQRAVPGSELIFTGEHGSDSRTYKVSFRRIFEELGNYFQPEWDLDKGGKELVEYFKQVGLVEGDFRGERTVRLTKLKTLIDKGAIDTSLRRVK